MKKTPAAFARALYVELMATPERGRGAVIRRFLRTLALERKSALKPRIVNAFIRLALAAEGKQAGAITTAAPIDQDTAKKIAASFPRVVFETAVDGSLIGGAVVRVGDEVRDSSVRDRIMSLRRSLAHES
jgi:F-type H+-transporting ATPase subunit delta